MKLPIELHTREGLMQLWSGVQHYPKQLQMKIKREIDRRNRLRHLGKPFKLVLLLLLFINLSYSQKTVDTNNYFSEAIESYSETDDCSVRALASVLYNYREAHSYLKKAGRKNYSPVSLRSMLVALMMSTEVLEVKPVESIKAKEFIHKYARTGFIYFVFNKYHIFTIKEDISGRFEIWGNPDDSYQKIIGYMRVTLKQ